MISKSLYSIFGLVYPKNLYDVIVLGNCLSEEAANTAREMGATIFDANDWLGKEECKLHWVFKQILSGDKSYDAVLVIQSESLLSGNYLDVLNHYFDQGSSVIQSSSLVLPESGSVWDKKNRFNFLRNNLLKPVGDELLGFSKSFRGNNFGFTTETLKENLAILPTFNQDKEYGLMLELKGIDVDFAPEAVVWKQMPIRADIVGNHSNKERFSFLKHYIPKLFKAAFRYKSLSYINKILDLITPSVLKVLVITLLMIAINILAWALADTPFIFVWIWLCISILDLLIIVVGGYAINTYFQAYKSII
ncbi:glycosyltransferase [Fodinibius salsisoli]